MSDKHITQDQYTAQEFGKKLGRMLINGADAIALNRDMAIMQQYLKNHPVDASYLVNGIATALKVEKLNPEKN